MSLAGRVAIVTGGAARIGAAIVTALAKAGASVCIHCGRSGTAAAELAARLAADGHKATTVSADLIDADVAARSIVGHCVKVLGPPDVLVCSASIFEPGTLESTTDDDWNRNFAVHVKAPAALCREFAASRTDGRRSHIVMLLDGLVRRPTPGRLAYAVSKCALESLTRILALELAPWVQVNGISPGAVLPSEEYPDDHRRRSESTIPLARTGSPDDVVRTLLFLLESDFITGQVIAVTGGEEL